MTERNDDLVKRFWPRELTNEQQIDCDVLRRRAEDLANAIVELTPKSREQSLALTQLETAAFWAVAAIARH